MASASGASSLMPSTLPPLDFRRDRPPRRTDLTDPRHHPSTPPPQRQHDNRDSPHAVRPASPYTFGSASATHHSDSPANIRRLLRSPASDRQPTPTQRHPDSRHTDLPHRAVSGPPETHSPTDESRALSFTARSSAPDPCVKAGDDLERDVDMHDHRKAPERSHLSVRDEGPNFDYSMRRHSIAAVQPSRQSPRLPSPSDRLRRSDQHRSPFGPAASHTLKRKMSHDRVIYSTLGEESDANSMLVDAEEPAPKRRGSAFDSRIAALSLYDRRDSLDSRSPASTQLWQDRRDSTSSMFSSISSVGGYSSSGFSGESHSKGASPFAWAPNAQQDGRNEAEPTRSFDPRGPSTPSDLQHLPPESRQMPSLMSMPPYPSDRRMSVPEATPKLTERALRPRSPRPPSSRGARSPTRTTPEAAPAAPASSDAHASPGSPTISESNMHADGYPPGHPGATPYSRSPELRVSHKLAERKRRKEMKELFDELRDQLPADRGMKASKWEILSKAVDFIQHLKTGQHDLHREIESLRHELETVRATAGSYAGPIAPPSAPHAGPTYPQAPPTAPYPPAAQVTTTPRGSVSVPYSQPGATVQSKDASPM